ncbi:MAG: formylglycine-generating enzyme family protein [candidate division Zixibacteria bacterium]|nr:formylglycine-generating enzyme family protein [candidate division Zixibacteria bacterium]
MSKNSTFLRQSIILAIVSLVLIIGSCSQSNNEPRLVGEMKPELVLIPGGEFMMGKDGGSEHSPAHEVHIDSFYMDKYEVTNAEFHEYYLDTDSKLPEFWGMEEFHCGPDFPDHPVIGVSSGEAKDYAEWAGKRLPTEAEWEYAARGGLVDMDYAHGNDLDTSKANYTLNGQTIGPARVGSYAANGFGLHDMTGNVVEWVADPYDKDYYKSSPADNPLGPEKGKFKVIRGGGWHTGPYCCRLYFRNALPTGLRDINVGFRCAKDLD